MPRGGARSGKQGRAYSNRSDLNQAPTTKRGQEYGQAKRQEVSQQMVPLPRQVPVQGPMPGQVPSLEDPSMYPDRPVTHGLPVGAGAGPEVLGVDPYDEELAIARQLYKRYPFPSLRRLIERWGA